MEQWEPIKYVSSNKNVQELLKMLYDHGSASYDQIKHLANSHIIQQLDSFGLIEYDQSRAFGLTKETVIKQSNYQLSTKGTNWYRLIISLATLSNDTVIVQLSIGDFKKFVNHLNNFLYSDKPEEIKDAYEFLLDDTSGNFYQRSDAKLNHLRDSARRLHTELINVRNDDSLLGAIDKLEKHINEFSSVSNDILNVLLKEGETIKERLDQLKNLESSHFYENITHHSNKITSPSIINANNDKSTYNMEDLLDQVKEVLPSLTNDDAFNQQLTTYGEQLIKANDEQNKIHKLRQEKAAIAKERHIVSQANQKAIVELNAIIADMERQSDKNQQKLDGLDEEIQSLEIQIEQNEDERSEIEDKLAKIDREKKLVQSQIQNLNIDAQIQALETELRYLSDTKTTTKKDQSEKTNRLSKIDNEIENINDQLNKNTQLLAKTPQPELPFDIEQWPQIEQAFTENENYLKESQRLAVQIQEKEQDLERQLDLIENTEKDLQELHATAQSQWSIEPTEVDELSNAFIQEHSRLLSEVKLLEQATDEYVAEFKELQSTNEPSTSFVATNARPLYKEIDFKDNVSEDEQRRIENLMRQAGLIELLVTANSITEGSILCKS